MATEQVKTILLKIKQKKSTKFVLLKVQKKVHFIKAHRRAIYNVIEKKKINKN